MSIASVDKAAFLVVAGPFVIVDPAKGRFSQTRRNEQNAVCLAAATLARPLGWGCPQLGHCRCCCQASWAQAVVGFEVASTIGPPSVLPAGYWKASSAIGTR